ncbi:MAG: hypothetical protein EP318_18110 [Rhodobacteraceae bacterium]|nr:MAG: hypothetical protein EP318_18110 [Paracoccaceae bacterium]
MARKFIASIAAAAVALTSLSAVPAAADNKTLEKFVIGAGTVLLLGELTRNFGTVQKEQLVQDTAPRANRDHRYRDRNRWDRRHRGWGRDRLAPIPGYCLTSVRKGKHTIRMFGARCLRNNYRHARFLPEHCKIQVKKRRHGHKIRRTGYSPKCLRREGFQVAGRGHY